MNYKSANSLFYVFIIMGIVTTLFLYMFEEVDFWFGFVAVLALLFLLAGIAIKVIFYRCPHCRVLLPLKTTTKLKYCHNCGEKLD
jgi:L-asparagine transporter-like permease